MSQRPPQSPLQPHPNIHEITLQNPIVNDGWNQAPLDHPNSKHQGFGQLVKKPTHNWLNHSSECQTKSSPLDDLSLK